MAQQGGGGGCLKAFLFGCGFLVLLVILGAGTVYYYRHSLIASTINVVVGQWLADAGLPHENRAEIAKEIDRLTDAIRVGNLSAEQVSQVLQESDVFYLLLLEGLHRAELPDSPLTPEQQEEARAQIQRVQRGVIEEKITGDQVFSAFDAIRPQGTEKGGAVSPAEWETLVASAKTLADQANIESGTYEIDLTAQVRDLVDALLGVTSKINQTEHPAPAVIVPASAVIEAVTP